MPGSTWSVQDAKNRFSALLEAARREPQTVTKHGRPIAVVVNAAEYERLETLEHLEAPPFNAHLLAIPADPEDETERLSGGLREPDL